MEKTYTASLMNRYYDERNQSMCSVNPYFKLDRVQWSSDQKFKGKEIDKNTQSLDHVFYTNDGVYGTLNNFILAKVTVPFSAFKQGEEHTAASIGILDGAGGLVAVIALDNPITLKQGRELDILIKIAVRES